MQKIVSLICCLFFIFTGFFIVEKIITYIDKKNTDETFMVNTYNQMDVGPTFTDYDGLTESQLPPKYINLRANNYDYQILNGNKVFTHQGVSIPVDVRKSKLSNQGVSYDGTPTAEKGLFMFANNKASLECCPSTYSTSTGCICTSKEQRNLINKRGNNRTLTDNNEF